MHTSDHLAEARETSFVSSGQGDSLTLLPGSRGLGRLSEMDSLIGLSAAAGVNKETVFYFVV